MPDITNPPKPPEGYGSWLDAWVSDDAWDQCDCTERGYARAELAALREERDRYLVHLTGIARSVGEEKLTATHRAIAGEWHRNNAEYIRSVEKSSSALRSRLQAAEEERDRLAQSHHDVCHKLQAAEEENARLRKAVEAVRDHHPENDVSRDVCGICQALADLDKESK